MSYDIIAGTYMVLDKCVEGVHANIYPRKRSIDDCSRSKFQEICHEHGYLSLMFRNLLIYLFICRWCRKWKAVDEWSRTQTRWQTVDTLKVSLHDPMIRYNNLPIPSLKSDYADGLCKYRDYRKKGTSRKRLQKNLHLTSPPTFTNCTLTIFKIFVWNKYWVSHTHVVHERTNWRRKTL